MSKKILKGVVTSAKNNKTIVVEVTRKFKHPFFISKNRQYVIEGKFSLKKF